MLEVVGQCGEPDELGGSGINIFIYHLDDGSLVAVGATSMTEPLLYANHIATTGQTSVTFSCGMRHRSRLSISVPGKRIIKGRPFEVGLIVRINAYNKERPHD